MLTAITGFMKSHQNDLSCKNGVSADASLLRAGPVASNGLQIVRAQAKALLDAQAMPLQPAMRLLDTLAGEALQGPFTRPRRFSAINADGFPFQWSVSLGDRPGGLRFVTDCGVPGSTTSERISFTRARLGEIAPALGLDSGLPALDVALAALLPKASLLDASLMGLCLGIEVDPTDRTRIKVYANGELDTAESRYRRFARCLSLFGRRTAAQRLQRLQQRLGARVIPAFIAIDLVPEGIGRLKLYFRPAEGSTDLLTTAADVLTGGGAAELGPLHHAFLDSERYSECAVDFSVEVPAEGDVIGFKVDLNVRRLIDDDAEVDRRVLRLLEGLEFDAGPYSLARDIVVGVPAARGVRSILFVGLAVRGSGRHVNIYLHPYPSSSH